MHRVRGTAKRKQIKWNAKKNFHDELMKELKPGMVAVLPADIHMNPSKPWRITHGGPHQDTSLYKHAQTLTYSQV